MKVGLKKTPLLHLVLFFIIRKRLRNMCEETFPTDSTCMSNYTAYLMSCFINYIQRKNNGGKKCAYIFMAGGGRR